MRPFPEKTGSLSVRGSVARGPLKGLACAQAVVFWGDPAGEASRGTLTLGLPLNKGGTMATAATAVWY